LIKKVCCNPLSFQGPKSEDDVGDGAEADELSGYDPESDATTMTVNYYYMHRCKFLFLPFAFVLTEVLVVVFETSKSIL